ncbi:MAG: hypothetical protein RL536_47 [Candidatus Parcubacteria bacterium]|jgi:uncharacterized protein YggE
MNVPAKLWSVVTSAVVLLTVFLAILSIKEIKSISYVGSDKPITNTITVSGKGETVAVPDVATFSFSVTETAKTVAEAQTKATDRANAALKAVKDAGVASKDIKTTSYSINPHYDYQTDVCANGYCRPGKQVLTGYEVSQSTQVKVRDLSKAGSIFSTIGGLNVDNVNNLSFSIDDIEQVKMDARAKAIADAQTKAKLLARQLGVSIVRIASFNDSSSQPGPMLYAMREDVMTMKAASAPAVAPEISVGEDKITSMVTITYEIR